MIVSPHTIFLHNLVGNEIDFYVACLVITDEHVFAEQVQQRQQSFPFQYPKYYEAHEQAPMASMSTYSLRFEI